MFSKIKDTELREKDKASPGTRSPSQTGTTEGYNQPCISAVFLMMRPVKGKSFVSSFYFWF